MSNIYSEFDLFEGYLELHGNWVPGHSPDDAAAILLGVAGYYGNLEVPLLAAQQIAEADTAGRFDSETDPDDFPWAALSDRYWHQKVELDGYPDEILTREELLRDAAPTGWHVIGPNLVYDPSVLPRTKKGFNYGAELQTGNDRMPERPFIGLSERAIAKIAGELELWAESIPIEMIGLGRGLGSNVLGEFPAVGGFFRAGGYQSMIKLPSGRVSFGKMIR